MNSNFTEKEIVKFERYNKKEKKNVIVEFPVVGGRLRLFHEDLAKGDNSQVAGGVDVEVIEHDREYALVKARVAIGGNSFTGIGMASKSRDSMIFPAIMEMAETRAIARALRFAGYGVEYTGAEEMQGLKKFDEKADQSSGMPDDITTREPYTISEPKVSQDVNDDMPGQEEEPKTLEGPSLKRQVWEFVVSLYPSVQENYLAQAIASFVQVTIKKYDDGDPDNIYFVILENRDRFANAFGKFVDDAIPDIKSPGVESGAESEEEKVIIEPTPEGGDSEIQKEYNESMKAGADNMKISPPPPAVDKDKVAKANIYRAMPDGISVAALNGTLKHLVTENTEYTAGDIYGMVLADIDGFMVMLKNWCANNDVPSGLEPKTEAPPKLKKLVASDPPGSKQAEIGKEFRKSWVRLDMENFHKFILHNCDTFKSDRNEYDLAVEKFDRLKAKNEDTKNLVFPYLFNAADIAESKSKPQLSTENSILEADAGGDKELAIMKKYLPMFPDLSMKISEAMGIDLNVENGAEALKFNEKIEELLTEYENEHKKAYTEE